eukprot:snap_masked-scaffold_20-processed-gene-1.28-mRNA-1 protein AED:1.00 eAED:1.00 QI:0/-1/0/0/-1/1/1/0/1212
MVETEENNIICIQIRDSHGEESENAIKIDLHNLPKANDLIGALQAEMADLSVWVMLATEYFRQSKNEDFEDIMTVATDENIEKYYASDLPGRLELLTMYINYLMEISKSMKPQGKSRKQARSKALTLLSRGEKWCKDQPSGIKTPLLLCKANYHLTQKQTDDALKTYMQVADSSTNVMAVLGLAKCYFLKGGYEKAFQAYKNLMMESENVHMCVYTGLALCLYKMGNVNRAKEWFQRSLEIESDNSEALLSLAIINIAEANSLDIYFDQDYDSKRTNLLQSASEKLSQVLAKEPNNSIALNHVANYLFQNDEKDLDRIKNVVKKAVMYTENDAVMAECLYIMGRNHHFKATKLQTQKNNFIKTERFRKKWNKSNEDKITRETMAEKNLVDVDVKEINKYFDLAQECYSKSLTLWSDFSLSHFGSAQALLQSIIEGKDKKSKKEEIKTTHERIKLYLESVLKRYPNDRDALYFLGYVHQLMGTGNPVGNEWKQIVDNHPDDYEVWLEIARYYQGFSKNQKSNTTDRSKALDAYLQAILGYSQHGRAVPVEVYNNIGVLQYSMGEYREAEKNLRSALHVRDQSEVDVKGIFKLEDKGEDGFILSIENISAYYNLARVRERLGNYSAAQISYKEIVKKFPYYTNGLLRLGLIAFRKGRVSQAIQYLQQAKQEDPKSVLPLLLLTHVYLLTGDKGNAEKRGSEIIKISKDLSYHRLLFANLSMSECQRKATAEDPEKIRKELDRAFETYKVILKENDQKNIFAANGLACIAAIEGFYDEAKQLFDKVREHATSISDPNTYKRINQNLFMNLGHLSILEKNYENARNYYEQGLRRYISEKDFTPIKTVKQGSTPAPIEEMRNSLANAHFLSKDQKSAKLLLCKNLKMNPSDVRTWYNLAVAEFQDGSQYLHTKLKQQRTAAGYRKALGSIERAEEVFDWLSYTVTQEKVSSSHSRLYVQELRLPRTTTKGNSVREFSQKDVDAAEENRERLSKAGKKYLLEPKEDEDEKSSTKRPVKERAPESKSFTKKGKAIEAKAKCKELIAVWSKHRISTEQKEKRQKQNREKIQKLNAKLREEKLAQEEEERAKKTEGELNLQSRLRQQEQHNRLIRQRLQEQKMKRQRVEAGHRKGRKRRKTDMDDFIVKADEVEQEHDDLPVSSSSDSEDSIFDEKPTPAKPLSPVVTKKRKDSSSSSESEAEADALTKDQPNVISDSDAE